MKSKRMVSDEPGPGNHRRDHLHDDYLHRVHRIASRFQRKTGAGFQMETVKTGDVTWACLKHNGEYIGCNTVETVK